MLQNFPEIWLKRVQQNLDNTDEAPFLEGIPELDVNVSQINEGDISEQNKIYVPSTAFEVDVLLNNTTYPIPVQEYADGTIEITLDKLQTKVTTLSDDQIIGSSYSKIDVVTASHTRGMKVSKFKKAIHSLAPQNNTIKTPVLKTTGGTDAVKDSTGRLILTYEDLVEFRRKLKGDDIRLVLCENHWNDLLLDRKNFGNQLVDYALGKPMPKIAGFELTKYSANPMYSASGEKKPYGAIPGTTDLEASIAFSKSNVAKKTGLTKQYFKAAKDDPEYQTNRLSYRHYYIVVPFVADKLGAII